MSSMDGDSPQYDDACHNLALAVPVSSQPTRDWLVVDSVEELQRITLFYLHKLRQPEHHSGMSAQARRRSVSGPSIALVTPQRRPQAPPLPYQASAAPWANIASAKEDADETFCSEFPSLSNNPAHQISNSSQSTWAMPSVRPLGQPATHRPQQGLLASQQQNQAQQQTQQQQDELFSSSSQLPASQGSFRYGGQNPVGRLSQSQDNTADEFPPLNRNANGEIGQDRSVGLLQNGRFGARSRSLGITGGIEVLSFQ